MHIAIVGATGSLGQDVVDNLNELNRENIRLSAFATENSLSESLEFADSSIPVQEIKSDSFKDIDLVILTVPAQAATKYAEEALKCNCQIIDASGALLSEKNPLVLYSTNINDADGAKKVIINPNPLAQQLVSILSPLDNSVEIKRVVSSTYQAVSGRGKNAIAELFEQSASLLSGQEHMQIHNFSTQIGFNCIPTTSDFVGKNAYEEIQVASQTQLLMKRKLPISISCVQIPTFIGYAQTLSIEFSSDINAEKVKNILEHSENIKVLDNPQNDEFSTPFGCAETNGIYVSRIRDDMYNPNTVNLWVVSDNLQLAALNITNIVKKLSSH